MQNDLPSLRVYTVRACPVVVLMAFFALFLPGAGAVAQGRSGSPSRTDPPDDRAMFDFGRFYRLPDYSYTSRLQHKDLSVSRIEAVFIIGRLFGYSDHSAYPDAKREALLAALAPRTFTSESDRHRRFEDLKPDHTWIYTIYSSVQTGIFNGESSTDFAIGHDLSRGELAAVLCRLLRRQPGPVALDLDGANFRDVSGREWWYGAALIASGGHLMEGFPDHMFHGERPVTREEFVLVINRLQKILPRKLR